MTGLAERIKSELDRLRGQPIVECTRAANMQMFGFGPQTKAINRRGDEYQRAQIRLHVQSRWRLVDATAILFASDDLNYPADDRTSLDNFDWDKHQSLLDIKQLGWFEQHTASPPRVIATSGDRYGGFAISLESGHTLECFPCTSQRRENSEHWRLFGHRADGGHFVITGNGIEGESPSES
jgi:hypothetical protein